MAICCAILVKQIKLTTMKIKSIALYVLIGIVIYFLFFFLALPLFNHSKSNSEDKSVLQNNEFLTNRMVELRIENTPLDLNTIIYNSEGNPIPINSLANTNTLFFRFSESSCSPCIQDQAVYINIMHKAKICNPIILIECRSFGHFKSLVKSYNLSCETYMLPFKNINYFGSPGLSYFFTLDTSLDRHNVFITHSKYPKHSIEYLQVVFPESKAIFK